MSKTLIVAQSEFLTLVRSKAFIISVILMPVVMGGSVVLVRATKDSADIRDRTFAIVDYSGTIGAPMKAAADAWNAPPSGGGARTRPRFLVVEIDPKARSADDVRIELSDRVRREELFAFVEVPAGILDPDSDAGIRYHSDHPSYEALPRWIETTANQIVLTYRFRSAAIDKTVVDRLTRHAPLDHLGLFDRDDRGGVQEAKEVDPIRAFVLPGVLLGLMYITVMSSAPQLLNSVIEEKMSRISEVLVASVTPFELMMGKLIGSAGVSLLLTAIYMAGGLVVAQQYGVASAITPSLVLWFALFLLMAVFIFGSMFVAIGAACTDLKDSQNMMTPVMLLVMLPVFTWAAVLRAPDGVPAVTLSLIPTAAPFVMMLRIALQPGPPVWQIALAVALMALTVVVCVWAAGKIFRTGLLMQGKSATIPEMVRWVRAR